MTEQERSSSRPSQVLGDYRSLAAVLIGVLLVCLAMLCGRSDFSHPNRDEDRNFQAAMVDRTEPNALETGSKLGGANDASKEYPSNFEPQELEQLSSPFTKKTVLELNEIVGRSLNAVQEFDSVRRSSEARGNRVEAYEKLAATAEKAQSDMEAASARLRESGEKYNKAIFAAMVRFVNEVDNEIRMEYEGVDVETEFATLN